MSQTPHKRSILAYILLRTSLTCFGFYPRPQFLKKLQTSTSSKNFKIFQLSQNFFNPMTYSTCHIKDIWDKVFKNGPSKIFLSTVFYKFYLIHSWILCLIYCLSIVVYNSLYNSNKWWFIVHNAQYWLIKST